MERRIRKCNCKNSNGCHPRSKEFKSNDFFISQFNFPNPHHPNQHPITLPKQLPITPLSTPLLTITGPNSHLHIPPKHKAPQSKRHQHQLHHHKQITPSSNTISIYHPHLDKTPISNHTIPNCTIHNHKIINQQSRPPSIRVTIF